MFREIANSLSKFTFTAAMLAVILSSPDSQAADIDEISEKLRQGDFSVVKTDLIPLAEAGNSRAQFNLGVSYAFGNGVEKNPFKAYEWTKKAAENGDQRAMVNLAGMSLEGSGTTRNVNEAAKWYESASAAGDVNATMALGKMYRDGATGKVDYERSYHYFSIAAAKGIDEAKYNLAGFYHHGLGVNKDEERARQLFASLKNDGNSFAALKPAAGNAKEN